MAEICWSCRSLGSAENHQLLLETRPAALFFLTCRHLRRSCRRMLEERGMSQPWGGRPGLGCRARGSLISRLSPDLQLCPTLSLCNRFSPGSSSVCTFLSQIILPTSEHGNSSWSRSAKPLCPCCSGLPQELGWRGRRDGWLLPLPQPCVCVRVLSVSLLAGIPQHCSPLNMGFPCAESVSLPTQHLTCWS